MACAYGDVRCRPYERRLAAPAKVASPKIPEYMAAVEPIVRPAVDAIDQPVRLSLKVGVPSGGDFLGAYDLDNYLGPLCGYFGIGAKLAAVTATKKRGGHSMVRVDPFRPAPPPTGSGWLDRRADSAERRAAIARQLATNVAAYRGGPSSSPVTSAAEPTATGSTSGNRSAAHHRGSSRVRKSLPVSNRSPGPGRGQGPIDVATLASGAAGTTCEPPARPGPPDRAAPGSAGAPRSGGRDAVVGADRMTP